MKDLLIEQGRRTKRSQDSIWGDEYSIMRITELRQLAHDRGSNVDASCELLILPSGKVCRLRDRYLNDQRDVANIM